MLMSLSMSKQLRFNRMLCKEKQKREKSAQEYLWVELFIPKQQLCTIHMLFHFFPLLAQILGNISSANQLLCANYENFNLSH